MAYPGEADLRWRTRPAPGHVGIAAFKLRSNDRWLVTVREIAEAVQVYATVPPVRRAALEAGPTWAGWLRWLTFAQGRGGFEAE